MGDDSTMVAHAQRGGFPVNSVFEVKAIIDPTSGE